MYLNKLSMVFWILVLFELKRFSNGLKLKNSCTDYSSYYFMLFDKDCYHDPDVLASKHDLLTRYAGSYESHNVTTDDGYILKLFRLSQVKPKAVAILLHPIATNSAIWMSQGNESLAFTLHNAGHEVWILNNRGTAESLRHVYLDTSSEAYWNFSFHEMGIYDYPATFKYVSNITGRTDLVGIGHSMGTTASAIWASLKPQEAKSLVKVFIQLGPIVYLHSYKSLQEILLPVAPIVGKLLDLFHVYSVATPYSLLQLLAKLSILLPMKRLLLMIAVYGSFHIQEFEPEIINVIATVNLGSFSIKMVKHYVQQVTSGGRFQMYDNGDEKNLEVYNSTVPPEYPVEDIIAPMYLVNSVVDSVSAPSDVDFLYSKLRNETKIYGRHIIDKLQHVDFHFGRDRIDLVFNNILEFFDDIF